MPHLLIIAFDDELLVSTTGTSIGFLVKIQASNIGGACEVVHSTAQEVSLIVFWCCVFIKTIACVISG